MKIYYSVYDAVERATGTRRVRTDNGWGRLVKVMEALLRKRKGFFIVDNPADADIEFYVGQPPLNLHPAMEPNLMLSMFETNTLPKSWVNSFNNWNTIINPSDWGRQCFISNGVSVPIKVVPLPIDFSKFKYVDRVIRDDKPWTYIAQACQLLDRKNIQLVAEVFENGSMPEDTQLILKTIPRNGQPELDLWINPQIRFLQKSLDFDDYYKLLAECHVSVNPSAGEGFAMLPCESMSTGMCTIMTKYSAMLNLLDNDCTLGIDCQETHTKVFMTGGKDADIDTISLKKQMLWTYENKEASLVMGRKSSEWIRNYCNEDKILNAISTILGENCNNVNKNVFDSLKPEDLVDREALFMGRR